MANEVILTTGNMFGGFLDPKRPFSAYGKKVTHELNLFFEKTAHDIADRAQKYIAEYAYLSGDLMRSVAVDDARSGQGHWEIYADIYYAIYVHEGTEKMAPRPFFEWAFTDELPEIIAGIEGIL